jgi:transcriptional regulator with XRE-family HTH domain
LFLIKLGAGGNLKPGVRLKEIRARLGITTRDVAEQSLKIAENEGNPEFAISHGWLADLEANGGSPSIYKLFSISAIYRIRFADLLLLFGIDLNRVGNYQLAKSVPKTYLLTQVDQDQTTAVSFPVRFDPAFSVRDTSLISRMVELWGQLPISMIQNLDLRHHTYGYIGSEDFTMFPMLRPGSFVQIDPRATRVQPFKGRTEFDRPIYFVELRGGYACGWCEIQNGNLLLVPHPLSSCSVRQYAYETEAEIVGQVTGVAMRIVEFSPTAERGTSKSPKLQ